MNNITEFLDQNVYNLTPQEYNEALEDLDKMDNYEWGKKYDKLFSDKTTGWYKVKKDFKPLSERLTASFGSSDNDNPFKKPKSFIDDVYQSDFQDVPREQFDKVLEQQSNYWEDFKKEREKESSEWKRRKEIDDWNKAGMFTTPWMKGMLTSEYEKQRYIDDPNKSLFGEQSPSLGQAPETRWGSIVDLGMGAAGAAGDVLPGIWGTVTGPTIRGVRDVGHSLFSDYKKEPGDIVKDVLNDYALNLSTDYMPTALTRYAPRVVKFQRKGVGGLADASKEVFNARDMKKVVQQTNNDLRKFGWGEEIDANKLKNMSVQEIEETIEKVNSPLLKQALQKHITKSPGGSIFADKEGIASTLMDFYKGGSDELANFQHLMPNSDRYNYIRQVLSDAGKNEEAMKYILDQNKAANLSKPAQRIENVMSTWEKYGDKAAKTLANAGVGVDLPLPTIIPIGQKRSSAKANSNEKQKEWYKQNYTRDWLANFKPSVSDQKANSLKWQAYKEWYFDKYGEMPKEDF